MFPIQELMLGTYGPVFLKARCVRTSAGICIWMYLSKYLVSFVLTQFVHAMQIIELGCAPGLNLSWYGSPHLLDLG